MVGWVCKDACGLRERMGGRGERTEGDMREPGAGEGVGGGG